MIGTIVFRANLKILPTDEERHEQISKVTQLLAEECAANALQKGISLFAIDCTAAPRIYADKVRDRTTVHSPTHVPGQKPITVGHEYSVLVYLPDREEDKEKHWVVPLSVKRVESHQCSKHYRPIQIFMRLCRCPAIPAFVKNYWIER